MVEFWTSIPLMALAALVTGALLMVLSVTDQRRPESVPVPVSVPSEPPPGSSHAGTPGTPGTPSVPGTPGVPGARTRPARDPSAPR